MRLAGKIALSTIAFFCILLALGSYALNQKVGNSQRMQASVQESLQNDSVSLAVGTAFVDRIIKDMSPAEQGKIKAPRVVLNRAAGKVIQLSSVPISVAVGKAYDAFLNNQTEKIRLHDAFVTVVKSMNSIDKNISVHLGNSDTGNFTITADQSSDHVAMLNAVKSLKRLINAWWIFLLIALGLFIGISFIDKRKSVGAWRWPGFIVFISGGLLLLVTSILPKLASEGVKLEQQDAVHTFTSSIDGGITAVATGSIIVGAALIILSFVMKG
jgi:hypothetical protein